MNDKNRSRKKPKITYIATDEGIERANKAVERNFGSRSKLIEAIRPSRSTVDKFFAQKPIEFDGFQEICEALGLSDWQTIAGMNTDDWNSNTQRQAIHIEADPELGKKLFRPSIPKEWMQRTLYLGDGGQDWLSIAKMPNYISDADINQILGKIRKIIQESTNVQTFISMGPGDAEIDSEIVDNLLHKELRYIPVDISTDILHYAFDKIKNSAFIPFVIQGDFEGGFEFIRKTLEVYSEVDSLTLVGLFGNTLGNLDKNEKVFLDRILTILNPGDYVLLDVSIANENYIIEADERGKPGSHFDEMRRFYAGGVMRQTDSITSREAVLKDYEKRIRCENRNGYTISDVPKTQSIDIYDTGKDNNIKIKIVSLRRYHWDSFKDWLVDNFKLQVIEEEKCFFGDTNLGSGMVLLQVIE